MQQRPRRGRRARGVHCKRWRAARRATADEQPDGQALVHRGRGAGGAQPGVRRSDAGHPRVRGGWGDEGPGVAGVFGMRGRGSGQAAARAAEGRGLRELLRAVLL